MIYPSYDTKNNKPINGTVFSLPRICLSSKTSCMKFHASHFKPGIYTCPHGFNTLVTNMGSIITGIVVSGLCDLPKAKRNGYMYRQFSIEEVQANIDIEEKYEEKCAIMESNETLIHELFHDVRKVNGTIKYNCEELLDTINPEEQLRKSILNIFDASNLVTARLNYYSYVVNPTIKDHKKDIKNVYRIYERCIQIFREQTLPRNVRFEVGNCWKSVRAYDIIEIVPFVILDNAIKYAPNNSVIQVVFKEFEDASCSVTVTSYGPKLEENEYTNVFLSGYRGRYVIKETSIIGAGLGLSVVKSICDEHGFSVKVESELSPRVFKGIQYWPFSITVTFTDVFQTD